MLTQSFLTAEELGIYEPERDALIKTLVLMETGKLTHYKPRKTKQRLFYASPDGYDRSFELPFTGHFNMDHWRVKSDCKTVACIGGTAEIVGNGINFSRRFDSLPNGLTELLTPHITGWGNISVERAARALRSYLRTGYPNWRGK